MKISRSIPLLLLGFCASVTGSVASAQLSQLNAPPLLPDLAQIAARGKLVVVQLNQNVPPMFGKNEGGNLVGFDIDLARAMAKSLRVKLEVRRTAESYDEVISQVAAGKADLGISGLARTARRAKYVLFSRPYLKEGKTLLINRVQGFTFHRSCPSVKEVLRAAEFSGILGLVMGSANLAQLRGLAPDAQPREFQSNEDLLAAVAAGKVAISFQGELVARRFLLKNPAARIRLRLCDVGRFQDHIAIAVPPGRYDLLHWVNVFLDEHEISLEASDLIAHKGPWIF